MISIALQEDEKELLGKHLKTSPLVLVRLKSQAIVMRNKGLKQQDIADLIFKDKRTVQRWIKEFSETRMASIFSGHQNNENAGKLTKGQKKEIKEALNKQPSEYGIPKEFWDTPSLKKYIDAKFDVVYESKQSYHFLLKFSNLSFKLPAKFDFRRDEVLINKRMNEINEEIKEYLNNNDWEIFASDEVRMELEALTRRAWLERSQA